MNALSALLPTHAMFVEAASAPDRSFGDAASVPSSDLGVLAFSREHSELPPIASGQVYPNSVSFESSVVNPPPDPIRKFVIVADPSDPAATERTIIFSRDIQHSTMVPLGHRAVSAGFLLLLPSGARVLNFDSESLHLGPRPQDQALLTAFLRS